MSFLPNKGFPDSRSSKMLPQSHLPKRVSWRSSDKLHPGVLSSRLHGNQSSGLPGALCKGLQINASDQEGKIKVLQRGQGLDSKAPPGETSLASPKSSHPEPPSPVSSGGALTQRSPLGDRDGPFFSLEIRRLQEPERSRLPRGWLAAGQVPKVLRPGTRQTGNSTCRASSARATKGAVP